MPPENDESVTELREEPLALSTQSEQRALDGGEIVADRFHSVALLGRGGMGAVFRPEDLCLGQGQPDVE